MQERLRRLFEPLWRRRKAESPPMDADRWQQVTALVDQAAPMADRRERARFLRRACQGDPGLLQEVERLLRFGEATGDILDRGLVPWESTLERTQDTRADPRLTAVLPADEEILLVGRRVGPYTVGRRLGRGGMGSVFLATDRQLERQVALKVIRRAVLADHLDTLIFARFDEERRILAQLDHPGVAKLFDTGRITAEDLDADADPSWVGLPYFTMEWVDGRPIDAHCDHHRLPLEERLRLVLQVADALEVAHRSGVVHRDLKPSNILVTTGGQVKLLDFGIAKRLDSEADLQLTETGQSPMSLPWASPEQVRGLPVTTASDLYSLGVVLYRLICGHPPYRLDGDYFENLRTVVDREPLPPSVMTTRSQEVWRHGTPVSISPETLAENQGSEPRRLARALRGDLDCIALRALAKEPAERYRSVAHLAEDLGRYLGGHPVAARQGTAFYRLGKLMRRHRRAVAVAGLVATILAVLGWIALDSRQQVAASQAEQRQAEAEAQIADQQAEALGDFVRNLLRSGRPDVSRGNTLTVIDILEKARQRVRRDFRGRPTLLANQLEALGLAFQQLGRYDDALPLLAEALAIRNRHFGEHPLVARSLNNLAALHQDMGDVRPAEKLYRLALGLRQRLGQAEEDLARVRSNLAAMLMQRGEYGEAERLYRETLELRRRLYGDDDYDVARSLRSLGILHFLRGDFEASEPLLRRALEIRRAHYDPGHTHIASTLGSLGRLLHAKGDFEGAEAALTETLEIRRHRLGDDHLHTALTRKDLADLFFDLGETAIAEVLWQGAEQQLRTLEAPDAWELADAESRLGARLHAAGRVDEAAPCLWESYQTLLESRGAESIYTRRALERWEVAKGLDTSP